MLYQPVFTDDYACIHRSEPVQNLALLNHNYTQGCKANLHSYSVLMVRVGDGDSASGGIGEGEGLLQFSSLNNNSHMRKMSIKMALCHVYTPGSPMHIL